MPHGIWDLSPPTRDRNQPPALDGWSPNHWPTSGSNFSFGAGIPPPPPPPALLPLPLHLGPQVIGESGVELGFFLSEGPSSPSGLFEQETAFTGMTPLGTLQTDHRLNERCLEDEVQTLTAPRPSSSPSLSCWGGLGFGPPS